MFFVLTATINWEVEQKGIREEEEVTVKGPGRMKKTTSRWRAGGRKYVLSVKGEWEKKLQEMGKNTLKRHMGRGRGEMEKCFYPA